MVVKFFARLMACRPFSRKISICRGSLWLISYCWSRMVWVVVFFIFNKDWQFHWKKKKMKKKKKKAIQSFVSWFCSDKSLWFILLFLWELVGVHFLGKLVGFWERERERGGNFDWLVKKLNFQIRFSNKWFCYHAMYVVNAPSTCWLYPKIKLLDIFISSSLKLVVSSKNMTLLSHTKCFLNGC